MATYSLKKVRLSCQLIILMFVLTLVTGCAEEELLPTIAPTIAVPTTTPTSTPSPTTQPTRTIAPTYTPVPTLEEPTLVPTNTATPVVSMGESTPLSPSGVNITLPIEGTEFAMGDELVVSGRAQLGAAEFISVTLQSATGVHLDETRAEVSEINSWQANLTVPMWYSGPAYLTAAVNDQEGALRGYDEAPIFLGMSEEPDERAVALLRPVAGDAAYGGYYLLFDGWVDRPLNNRVTVSLWSDDCRQRDADETLILNGSGSWWGLLFVPTDLSGRICAAASFGEPGDSEWRESLTFVEAIPPGDEQPNGAAIALPRKEERVQAGQSMTIEGLAFNAPESLVTVSILLDNGRILNEGVAGVDQYGYWELSLLVPPEAEGIAHIIASIGLPGDDDYSEISSPIIIEP